MLILFADDTNPYCSGKHLGDIVREINVEIDYIYQTKYPLMLTMPILSNSR